MSDFFKLFEAPGAVTLQQVLAALALIAPGFISLRVYDMQRGGEGRQAKDVLVDIMMYSFASDAIVYAAWSTMTSVLPPVYKQAITVATLCLFIATPIALGRVFYELQRAMMLRGTFPDTLTPSWRQMMDRIGSEGIDFGAIITTHDGQVVGARIGQSARVASCGEDLLLDEVWTIAENGATLVSPSPCSYGLLMRRSDCRMIEFVRLAAPANVGIR